MGTKIEQEVGTCTDVNEDVCMDCGEHLKPDEDTLCSKCLCKDDKFYANITLK